MIYCVVMGVSSTMTSDYDYDRFYLVYRLLDFVYAVVGNVLWFCVFNYKFRV